MTKDVIIAEEKSKKLSLSDISQYINIKMLVGAFMLIYIVFHMLKLNLFYIDTVNDSDIAAEYLLAKIQSEEFSLFSSDWYYSFDIRVLYLQIVASFLFRFTSNYYVVMGFTNLIWTMFFALSYYFLAGVIGMKKDTVIFTMPLILTAFSKNTIYYMYGGGFYLPYLTWIFVVFSLMVLTAKKKNPIFPVLMAVLSLMLGMSGFRYMAILFLPMFIGSALLFFFETEKLTVKTVNNSVYLPYIYSTLISCVFAFLGFIINSFYLVKQYPVADLNDRGFIYVSELGNHFLSLCVSFIQAFGFNSGVSLFSLRGLANCVGFLLFFMLIYACCKVVKIWKEKNLSTETKVFLFFCLAAFVVIVFISLFTGDMSTVLYKYVLHSFVLMLVIIGIYLTNSDETVNKILYGAILVCIVIFLNAVSYRSEISDGDCLRRHGYIEYLTQNQLTYGYATFWNCDITAFMCNNNTQVVPIQDAATLEKLNWLAEKKIFNPQYNTTGKYFILLTQAEVTEFTENGHADTARIGYEDENYVIYLMDGAGF